MDTQLPRRRLLSIFPNTRLAASKDEYSISGHGLLRSVPYRESMARLQTASFARKMALLGHTESW